MISRTRLPDKLVIFQPWGGLGDNLQFSTLPEMFDAQGVPCFVSTGNALRNAEIGKLVWDLNPYVKGYSEDKPNAGSCVTPVARLDLPYLSRVELAHGLRPTSALPKVYYQPKRRPEFTNLILMDLGSISVQHRRSGVAKYIDETLHNYDYERSSVRMVALQRSVASVRPYQFDGFERFQPRDIFEYCDALASCRALITVHSGAQSLAVGLRGAALTPIIHCYCTPNQFNGRGFIYPNVEYYVADRVLHRPKLVRSLLKRAPLALRRFLDSRS